MKPRHAAALALVGWYLVYPTNPPAPYSGDFCCQNEVTLPEQEYWCWKSDANCLKVLKGLGITNTNPLWKKNEWKVMRRFDTERGCKIELETHGLSAKCMSSDDPRLKEAK
jgi:hypothetical protein